MCVESEGTGWRPQAESLSEIVGFSLCSHRDQYLLLERAWREGFGVGQEKVCGCTDLLFWVDDA